MRRRDVGALHRVWQGLLHLPSPVSIHDICLIASDDGRLRSTDYARMCIQRVRRLHFELHIRFQRRKGEHGYIVTMADSRFACRSCGDDIRDETASMIRVRAQFCADCFRAYKIGRAEALKAGEEGPKWGRGRKVPKGRAQRAKIRGEGASLEGP